MMLESLGVIKAASALKGAAIGLMAAVPPLINNSAIATQQLVTIATPVVAQSMAAVGAGLAALGVTIAKGTATLKASLASAGGAKAASVVGTLTPPVA